jgi:Polymerase beta, Nucleotidyltransferase
MTIDEIVSYLRAKYEPKAILLHGSRARGDAFEQSDYDLALLTENPDQVKPECYEGCALDISGVSPTEAILKSGKTPIWPCLVLYDDSNGLGEHLANQTQLAFIQGPILLTKEELENRRNFSKRLIQRIQGRGDDPMVRLYYIGDFYQRALRYWCEINHRWTMSAHQLLPLIAREDPTFYQMLKDLWTEDYQNAAQKIHQHLFKKSQ